MALEALKQAEKHTVGVKQTEKAVARQVAAVVYIASDADERVTSRLMQLCRENSVPVEHRNDAGNRQSLRHKRQSSSGCDT